MTRTILTAALAALTVAACGQGGGSDATGQQIHIVGSSTVYPFTTAVAERFAQGNPSFGAPIVESTGTGAGMKLFCGGVGDQFPDMSNASRRIKKSEYDDCAKNGVRQVIEVPVGIDGLALIEGINGPAIQLTQADVYKALAATPFGKAQSARTWKDVNPALPAIPIRVFGPPPTSGTRDSFAELILEKGCDSDPAMKALKESDSDRHKAVCTKIREDGAYVEAGENDNLLVQKVAADPNAIGILGYSFLEENAASVKGIALNGIAPTAETIGNLSYPGARQIYIYAKGEHANVIPGMKEFLAEYARAWGAGGYLTSRGLIPSPADVQTKAAAAVQGLTPVNAAELK